MENEIELYLNPSIFSGKTVFAKLFIDGIQIGSDLEMEEVGTSGNFIVEVPSGTSENEYALQFYWDGNIISNGKIYWNGEKIVEIPNSDQNDIADKVYDRINDTTDPLENYNRIKEAFKKRYSYLYDYAGFNYFIKMNQSLNNILKDELDISGSLTSLNIEGFTVTIQIDSLINNKNFVLYEEPIPQFPQI